MKFVAYNPFIKQLRADKGWRVEFDVSQDEYDTIKELPKLEGVALAVEVAVLEDGIVTKKKK